METAVQILERKLANSTNIVLKAKLYYKLIFMYLQQDVWKALRSANEFYDLVQDLEETEEYYDTIAQGILSKTMVLFMTKKFGESFKLVNRMEDLYKKSKNFPFNISR